MDSKALPQQSSTTKSVSASEIPKVMQFLESKSNNRLEFLVDDSNTEIGMNRNHEENLTLTTTLTDQIKMVTNNYGKSNYTFELIEQADKNSTYFLNLVVKEYKDEFYMYIVKYVPDTTWLETHHMIKDFNVFTGYIYFYSDIGTYIGKADMANGEASSGFDKHPCDGESSGSEGNDGNGSSTSGWDGNPSGGDSVSGGTDDTGTGGFNIIQIEVDCSCHQTHASGGCTHPDTVVIIGGGGANYSAGENLNQTLRHPCNGGNGSGGGTTSVDCNTITGTTCDNIGNTLMEWDENCNCVEAEAIEGSVVSTVYFEKEYQMFLDDLDLSDEQHEFLDNLLEDNPDIDQELQDYLLENGFSEEAEAFVEEAVEALEDGGEVDFPEKVIYDSSVLANQKLRCVFQKLSSLTNSFYSSTLNELFGGSKESNIVFRVNEITTTVNGNVVPLDAFTTPAQAESGNQYYFIDIHPDFINNSSILAIANVVIHEVFHAEIFERLRQLEVIDIIDLGNGDFEVEWIGVDYQMFNNLDDLDKEGVVVYANEFANNPEWQHSLFNLLAYRQQLISDLQDFHETYDDSSFENSLSNQNEEIIDVFEALSWLGLNRTSAYEALDSIEQSLIESQINNAKQNSNQTCQ